MHACEAETSLMLYLYPEKVRMEKAVDEEVKFKKFSVRESLVKTKSGVFGYPSKATMEKGRKIFERIVSELKEFILECGCRDSNPGHELGRLGSYR